MQTLAKYLVIIALACCCSGFNICETKVLQNGIATRIYIYPDCNDTSCYLKLRYQANHVVEYLYIGSQLRFKRILDKAGPWIANEYTYEKGKGETHRVDTMQGALPDECLAINDTCALNIEYYGDGGIHICTYGYNRALECQHTESYASTIVFDSLYKGKMQGSLQIICDTNTVTDAFTNEDVVKIVHRERQKGMWHTYAADNRITDSTYYDPLKKPE